MTNPDHARDILTQAEAEARAERVSGAVYTLSIDLQKGSVTYRGEATIRFSVSGEGDTFLDFRGKAIERLVVNGETVSEPQWSGYRLVLPGRLLAPDTTVSIAYENEYDHGGDGFHQFVDPEDGEEYLYSNFEPYEAHRLFPCFDQPDIKGSYDLAVTAPPQWEIIANSPVLDETQTEDRRRRLRFVPTKPLSTYLFALIAGPYHVERSVHEGIDLGLFCRKSLVKHLDAREIFEISSQGLDFYAGFFDYPYAFGKYDQIFVPEFNAGAMENAGAVTHNEYMIFRDPPTDNQRRGRAETILHEMAHMWFGDLVTMRWWNDLWLNESFATYMSYLCLTTATRFKEGWQDFNSSIKNWAYRQDQLVTTHPIAGQVADTDQTFLNFDGITYGKGASVLKQLVAAIGMEGFRAGMREYFREFEYRNATLAQFIHSLERGSGRDLQEWSRLWLETPSLNTIGSRWTADGDHISAFTLTQTAPAGYPTLRPHRLEVGLIREEAGALAATSIAGEISGPEAHVAGARGVARPSFVFPNYNDHDYAKVALDPESLRWVLRNIERIEDTLLRQLVWSSLWNMVRDQQLKSTEFLALVRQKLPLEPMSGLIDSVLGQASGAMSRYVPEERREQEFHLSFNSNWDALVKAPEGDQKIIWARALVGSAVIPEDIERVARLADGEESIPGVSIDQDMHWAVAAKCMAHNLPGARERVAREIERDPSDRGQRAKLRAEVSAPSAGLKAEAWARFNDGGYGSLYLTGAAMSGFNWTHQRDILAPYVEAFFEALPRIYREKDKEYQDTYFSGLFPSYRVEEGILDRARAVLTETGDDLPVLARKLREANDDLERAIKCRRFAAS